MAKYFLDEYDRMMFVVDVLKNLGGGAKFKYEKNEKTTEKDWFTGTYGYISYEYASYFTETAFGRKNLCHAGSSASAAPA